MKDIAAIEDILHDLPTLQGFAPSSRPFVYQTVVEFNEFAMNVGDYYNTGVYHIIQTYTYTHVLLLNFYSSFA